MTKFKTTLGASICVITLCTSNLAIAGENEIQQDAFSEHRKEVVSAVSSVLDNTTNQLIEEIIKNQPISLIPDTVAVAELAYTGFGTLKHMLAVLRTERSTELQRTEPTQVEPTSQNFDIAIQHFQILPAPGAHRAYDAF